MSLLQRIFGTGGNARDSFRPLYAALVERARDPAWYGEGRVPDTVDGRFDMVTAIVALALLRLEKEGDAAKRETVLLTELYIEDMEGNIRQMGIGDLNIGKHVGRMVSALGGRLEAFRGADDLEAAVRRNIFHDAPPSDEGLGYVAGRLTRFREALDAQPAAALLAGEVPRS